MRGVCNGGVFGFREIKVVRDQQIGVMMKDFDYYTCARSVVKVFHHDPLIFFFSFLFSHQVMMVFLSVAKPLFWFIIRQMLLMMAFSI